MLTVNDLYTQDGVIEKDIMWECYIPLVRHEALKLQVRLPVSVELDDLVQVGGIGLLDALERFDADKALFLPLMQCNVFVMRC